MASRIILDPETLLAQAGEMQNLTAEYENKQCPAKFRKYYRTSFQWGCCSKKQCYNHAVGRPVSF